MRFLLVALLWLITFGTGDVASAQTDAEALTLQCQKGNAAGCSDLAERSLKGTEQPKF